MKKVIAILAFTMIVLVLCYIPTNKAETENDVVINADGTITPSTAPIQRDGDIYRLTSSYEGTLLILRSNIAFDGNGNFIQSPDNVAFCVKLDSVSNVTVKNLSVRGSLFGCMYGIELADATNCLITNNTITDVWSIMAMNAIAFDGIHVNGGNSNLFTKNILRNNLLGMNFIDTTNNTVIENSIDYVSQGVNSVPSGINFYQSSGNVIYHNSFRTDHGNAGVHESNNTWDNGFPIGGNYWSDYGIGGSNFSKISGTTIYDSPYLINGANIDHYPLSEPYTATTPIISILSSEGSYNVSSVRLVYTVDQPAAWMGYSLDGAQNVTLSGNQTLTGLGNGQHTVAVFANDSFGNMGSAEFRFTVSVPLSSILVVGVFILAIVAAVVGGVVIYRYTKASTKHTKTAPITG